MTLRKVVVMALLAAPALSAWAQSNEIDITLGVKGWHNTWKGTSFAKDAAGNYFIPPVTTNFDHDPTTAVIPTLSVRYGSFGFTGSALLQTGYHGSDGVTTYDEKRRELDANLLYYFYPSMSVSVGYKSLRYGGITIDGVTTALSASAPISGPVGMYGTVGYGFMKTEAPEFNTGKRSTKYSVVETGVTYSFSLPQVKAATLTGGYRFQKFTTNNWPAFNTFVKLTDITHGPTVGFLVTF
ncbi:MAG: hypothetical protein ABIR26_18770 [Ramlibacter sp.]